MGTRPGGSGVDTWQQVEYLGITSLLIRIGNVRRLRLQPRLAVRIIVRALLQSVVLVNYADVVTLPVASGSVFPNFGHQYGGKNVSITDGSHIDRVRQVFHTVKKKTYVLKSLDHIDCTYSFFGFRYSYIFFQ